MKTKRILAVIAALMAVFSLTACLSEKGSVEPSAEAPSSTVFTTKPGDTTVKPFVEAQTQIITSAPSTKKPESAEPTAEKVTDLLVKTVKSWPNHALLKGLPKANAEKIKQAYEYKNQNGVRYVVALDNFGYEEYLTYIGRIEAAGFKDNNDRANIPSSAPNDVAMFYSKFDGERSFGIYWHGKDSKAGFDCMLVICDYDMAA